jgi:peptidoglycan/LPS O-acetylase OafA/YrhL
MQTPPGLDSEQSAPLATPETARAALATRLTLAHLHPETPSLLTTSLLGNVDALGAGALLATGLRISYGVYMYHWPIVVLSLELNRWMGEPLHGFSLGAARSALTLAAAAAFRRFIEVPASRLKRRFEYSRPRGLEMAA